MREMSMQRFLDQVFEGYEVGKRYCFILGSGASCSSGIRTGMELMQEWWNYLRESPRGDSFIRECAADLIEQANQSDDDDEKNPKAQDDKKDKDLLEANYFDRFFKKTYALKSSDYFDLFDLRFVTQPEYGYRCLEKEMEGKEPNYGYFALATILANTENRLVITTNFDSLSEDALFIYTDARPQVVGHESLAQYMVGNFRRPVIAKVHRGLYFSPLNRKEEIKTIQEEWKVPLQQALEKYIPIVIGYGGGDKSLMSYLKDECPNLECIYWCDINELQEGSEPVKLLEEQHGRFVHIAGFDDLMFDFLERFHDVIKKTNGVMYQPAETLTTIDKENDYCDPHGYMEEETSRRYALWKKNFIELRERRDQRRMRRLEDERAAEAKADPSKTSAANRKSDQLLDPSMHSYSQRMLEKLDKTPDEHKNAEYYNERGQSLHQIGKDAEAIKSFNDAIKLEPENDVYLANRGLSELFIGGKENAKKAIKSYTQALAINNTDANYYYWRANAYYDAEQYGEALPDIDLSIQLDPDNCFSYLLRAEINYALGKENMKAVKEDMLVAIKSKPYMPEFAKNSLDRMTALPTKDKALIELTIKRYISLTTIPVCAH